MAADGAPRLAQLSQLEKICELDQRCLPKGLHYNGRICGVERAFARTAMHDSIVYSQRHQWKRYLVYTTDDFRSRPIDSTRFSGPAPPEKCASTQRVEKVGLEQIPVSEVNAGDRRGLLPLPVR
jgi:hypothetical protein